MPEPPKIEAFLFIDVSLEELSAVYADAVSAHISSEPAILMLPWPTSAIPAVNAEVGIEDAPFSFSELTVSKHEYVRKPDGSIRIEVTASPTRDSGPPISPDMNLRYAAQLGFLFFPTLKPVKEVLEEAGLFV